MAKQGHEPGAAVKYRADVVLFEAGKDHLLLLLTKPLEDVNGGVSVLTVLSDPLADDATVHQVVDHPEGVLLAHVQQKDGRYVSD